MKKFRADWKPAADVQSDAARVLPAMLRQFFAHGDKVVKPHTSERRLHQFRLAAKRIRYTLELFEPLYGAAIKAHLEGIKKVQQVLGQLNDCQASLELIPELEAQPEPGWLEAIVLRRDKKRSDFIDLWLDEFTDPVRREDWMARLEQPAGTLLK